MLALFMVTNLHADTIESGLIKVKQFGSRWGHNITIYQTKSGTCFLVMSGSTGRSGITDVKCSDFGVNVPKPVEAPVSDSELVLQWIYDNCTNTDFPAVEGYKWSHTFKGLKLDCKFPTDDVIQSKREQYEKLKRMFEK